MKIGIITGSGFYDFAEIREQKHHSIKTKFGEIPISEGELAGQTVFFVGRHGQNHQILSNQINHRAYLLALKKLGAECIIGTTITGIVQPNIKIGQLIIFDELYFPENRLPGGEICTVHDTPSAKDRGHLILANPFSPALREIIQKAAAELKLKHYDKASYAHVNGPRFNTALEIKALQNLGVTAVSQTAGPEAVLAAELEIPYALIGFGVDYANQVKPAPTPVEELNSNMQKSKAELKSLIIKTLELIKPLRFDQGFVYRFE